MSLFQIFSRKRAARFRSVLTILTLSALPLSASTLASTFSTGNPSFDPATGDAWVVGGSGNAELAAAFQVPSGTQSYLLTQIQVAANFSSVNPDASSNPSLNNLIVGIWQATTDNPNGAIELQSWSIAAPGSTGMPGQIYTLNSASSTILDPADYYFITETVTPDGAKTAEWGWQENNLTPMQIGYYTGTNGVPGSWTFDDTPCTTNPCTATNDPNASGTPAFSVSGNLVTTPEPSYVGILGPALLVLLALRRYRLHSAE